MKHTTLILGEARSGKSGIGRALAMGAYTAALQGAEPAIILLVESFAHEKYRNCWRVTENFWTRFPTDENVMWKEYKPAQVFTPPEDITHLIWVTDLIGGEVCPFEYQQLIVASTPWVNLDRRGDL